MKDNMNYEDDLNKSIVMNNIHKIVDFSSVKRRQIVQLLGITFAQAGNLTKGNYEKFYLIELKTFLSALESDSL